LARPLARDLNAPLAGRALARIRDTPQQASLDRSKRLRNVRSAFAVRDVACLRSKRILLVDDVRTTGATLSACADAMRAAGAAQVFTLVLASAEA
jgi:predicted amidophosphoribosyltransferase